MLKIDEIIWGHGWQPTTSNSDIDRVVGESGETSSLRDCTYFVARKDQVQALVSVGVPNAHAIGLPFAWAMKASQNDQVRIPNSLLVVPAFHGSHSDTDNTHIDEDYINYLLEETVSFDVVGVIMNCDDFRIGRHREWERRGFTVELGGCESDTSSLYRLVRIFSRFETMTTNAFGSPIAYAGACGAKVSISGPTPPANKSALWAEDFYRNRPDLKLIQENWISATNQLLREKGLYCPLPQAKDITRWAREQIGHEHAGNREFVRGEIRRAFRRHTSFLDRLGFRPIKKKLSKIMFLLNVASANVGGERSPRPLSGIRNIGRIANFLGNVENTSIEIRGLDYPVAFRPRSTDELSIHRHFVKKVFSRLDLGSPKRILYLGAYAGFGAIALSHKFPEAQVIAVEPDSANFSLLRSNAKALPLVKVINKAVWVRGETVSILPGPRGEWSTKVIPKTEGFDDVEGITVQGLLNEFEWDNCDVILMDIEGSEYEILRGLDVELGSLSSILVVRFAHKLARHQEFQEIASVLNGVSSSCAQDIEEFTVFDFR